MAYLLSVIFGSILGLYHQGVMMIHFCYFIGNEETSGLVPPYHPSNTDYDYSVIGVCIPELSQHLPQRSPSTT